MLHATVQKRIVTNNRISPNRNSGGLVKLRPPVDRGIAAYSNSEKMAVQKQTDCVAGNVPRQRTTIHPEIYKCSHFATSSNTFITFSAALSQVNILTLSFPVL